MSRIIAGSHKGHRLATPPGEATRPTSDRVRESLFAIIGERVDGSKVLDLFAGSGSLGIEALSRGAGACVFVERDRHACHVIMDNLSTHKNPEAVAAIAGGSHVSVSVESRTESCSFPVEDH